MGGMTTMPLVAGEQRSAERWGDSQHGCGVICIEADDTAQLIYRQRSGSGSWVGQHEHCRLWVQLQLLLLLG